MRRLFLEPVLASGGRLPVLIWGCCGAPVSVSRGSSRLRAMLVFTIVVQGQEAFGSATCLIKARSSSRALLKRVAYLTWVLCPGTMRSSTTGEEELPGPYSFTKA